MPYRISTTLCSSLILAAATAAGADIGKTYAIAEPDTITEIEQRASGIDWQAKWKSIDIRKKIRSGGVVLPPAKSDRSYQLDLTYELEMDIPDNKGGVLYPKGYRFNPVKYMRLPFKMAVIGKRQEEIEWARGQEGAVIWMTAGGDPLDLTQKIGQPVYLYTPDVAKKFKIQGTPALIEQRGEYLVATEYLLAEGTKNSTESKP